MDDACRGENSSYNPFETAKLGGRGGGVAGYLHPPLSFKSRRCYRISGRVFSDTITDTIFDKRELPIRHETLFILIVRTLGGSVSLPQA